MTENLKNELVTSFIPWNDETKNEFYKKYEAKDENDFFIKATYDRDVKVAELYQYMNKRIYCNDKLKRCWYADTYILNDTDNENLFNIFNKLLSEAWITEIDYNCLWFNFYKNWVIEVIEYKWKNNRPLLTFYPSNVYLEKYWTKDYKEIMINTINNLSDLDNESKSKITKKIKDINNIEEINDIIKEEIPYL